LKTRELVLCILLTSFVTLIVSGIITLLWNLLIEKSGAIVDWKTSFVFAIILGLVIPIVQRADKEK